MFPQKKINQTFIALIPKIQNPISPKDFRPISLCNVIFKIITKTLANRIKPCLPSLIHETQSAFVPGRQILDNGLLALENFHFMKNKKSGSKGFYALKLDMSKAYDRVESLFLEKIMEKMCFPPRLIKAVFGIEFSSSKNGFKLKHKFKNVWILLSKQSFGKTKLLNSHLREVSFLCVFLTYKKYNVIFK